MDTVTNRIKYEKRIHRSVKKLYDCSSQVQGQAVFQTCRQFFSNWELLTSVGNISLSLSTVCYC